MNELILKTQTTYLLLFCCMKRKDCKVKNLETKWPNKKHFTISIMSSFSVCLLVCFDMLMQNANESIGSFT